VERPARPVLDLACGPGHLTRYLARRAGPEQVVGVDRTFALLHVARVVTAPDAEFVCADATAPLPFRDAVFSFVFCSDAFHYLAAKELLARQMRRVGAPGGAIALLAVRNANVKHLSAGAPLTPAGYVALFADRPWRILAEDRVLRRYLERRGPALEQATSLDEVATAPNLALVASDDPGLFADRAPYAEWPHGEGHLEINPLYRVERAGGGDVTLRRVYPSPYYEQEHEEGGAYLPAAVSTTAEALAALGRDVRTPEVERLVDQFVALGMPPRWGIADAA
jgi:SAM-dependent methyltransferase